MDAESKSIEICKMLPMVSRMYADISSMKEELNDALTEIEEQEMEMDLCQEDPDSPTEIHQEGDGNSHISVPSNRN